jgi:hypothetical protein
MEMILGGLAFALMMAAQVFAVIAVHRARLESKTTGRLDFHEDARGQHIWLFGG